MEVCKEDYGNRDALEEEHDPGEKQRILLFAYHQELCSLIIPKVEDMRLASCLLFPNNVKTRIWKPGEQDDMEKGEQLNSQNRSSRDVFQFKKSIFDIREPHVKFKTLESDKILQVAAPDNQDYYQVFGYVLQVEPRFLDPSFMVHWHKSGYKLILEVCF